MATFGVHLLAFMPQGFRCRSQFTVKAKDQATAEAAADRLMRNHTVEAHSMNALAVEIEQTTVIPETKES
jgi:hypothetical protein